MTWLNYIWHGNAKNILYTRLILAHWGRHKIAAISQRIYSNTFSWMKMYAFWLRFHCNCSYKGPINHIPTLDQIMAWADQVTSHYLNQWWSSLLTHIYVTRLKWIKLITDTYVLRFILCFTRHLPGLIRNRIVSCWKRNRGENSEYFFAVHLMY